MAVIKTEKYYSKGVMNETKVKWSRSDGL